MLDGHLDVFSTGEEDIGHAAVSSHKIELYDYTPIRQRPRSFPEPVTTEIEKQCEELVALDVIEPSKSPWSSPVVPVRKKDGTLRLCIDYRQLNKVTKPDRYPMPNLRDSVFGLHKKRYFTSLDLVKGYYQVPLDPESREFTAFSTKKGHYHFKKLSFGLRNCPSAFMREMNLIFNKFGNDVIIYIDDILVVSENFNEHVKLVNKVMNTLKAYGLKIKVSKCKFFQQEVEFLGHKVGRNGISKSKSYVEQVKAFPKPETVTELKRFLGMVNFLRMFIDKCSIISAPLNELTGFTR